VSARVRSMLVAACVLVAHSRAAETPPSVLVQQFFDGLQGSFERVASDRTVTMVELKPTTRLFAQVISENPVLVSLVRTNSKGSVINEYVDGRGAVRAYRSLASQRWYAEMRQSLSPHKGAVSDRNGKTYLLWAQPVVLASTVGTRRFSGAIVAKVDLLSCLEAISKNSEYPFRVAVGGVGLFSHRWETGLEYDEAAVEVPGLRDVVVYEIRKSPPPSETLVTDFDGMGEDGEPGEDGAGDSGSAVNGVLASVLTGRALLLGIAVFVLVWFVRSRLRWRALLGKVHEEVAR